MRQITFACQPSFEKHPRSSRREHFLGTMETVVPWSELEALIEPYYPNRGIVKNHHWHLAAFALVNLYQHRKRLLPQLAPLGA
jgi:hypothetical protein